MKKIYSICTARTKRRATLRKQIEIREAGRLRHVKFMGKYNGNIFNTNCIRKSELRDEFVKKYYSKQSYQSRTKNVYINTEFGIEEPKIVNDFFKYSLSILHAQSRRLIINFKSCSRVWPSAVTLLCALMQWNELVSDKGSRQTIGQIPSAHSKVNSYLYHCGFYDYVKINGIEDTSGYSSDAIVKINREGKKSNTYNRESEIENLLKKYTDLTSDEIEVFGDRIATEIFNNVTEHGISHKDAGWWVLAQHHEKHGIVSICVADNGIGIRNSLLTGPQRDYIKHELRDDFNNEGMFIKKAMERNISGAFAAPEKKEKLLGFIKQYQRGPRRGKGLERIRDNCKYLGIRLAILSCHGYFILDEYGNEESLGAFPSHIFAGTMYHLTIKTRRDLNGNYKYRNQLLPTTC